MKKTILIALFLILASQTAFAQKADAKDISKPITWREVLRQKPEWYASAEAVRIADNVLLWQRRSGGWPKNTDMAVVLSKAEADKLSKEAAEPDSTIDNGATREQLIYLAKVFNATRQPRFKEAFLKGLDYLFAAQYANGGWPQFFPLRKGYYSHITFNDGAMAGVLTLLHEIARKHSPYTFVDEVRRLRAEQAVAKGIECILKTQVVANGKRTVWCAQHDEVTLQPAPARAYEKISLSGSESVGIVQFLMGIEKPDMRVIESIQSAAAWFEQVKLTGIKVIEKSDPALPKGFDRVVVQDAQAPPLWARFYEIGTNRPIFCGRDGVVKYSLAEIEVERRSGYRWYWDGAAKLLVKDYPAWRANRK
jgi:PelA/Pel-15E family pectate lyase